MNHLSLFSGSGIGTLAAAACGIKTVAHAENDPACCYCLERLWPDARLFRDVRDVTAESVADLGPIDICSGGFPCTDISTAGKGAGLGTEENPTRSGLWYEFARVIREVRPPWVLIENTPGLRVRGGDRVCFDLEAMGYSWESVVVGAWAVGAPHKRDRVWIVARRQGDGCGQRRTRGLDSGDAGQRELALQGMANRPRQQRDERTDGDGTGKRGHEGLADAPRIRQPQYRDERSGDGESSGAGGAVASPASEWTDGEPVHETELGHPASDDQRRPPVAAMHGEGDPSGGSSGGCGELADARQSECTEPRQSARRAQPAATSMRCRWPARPGEPQHEWEAPRLVEFHVGSVPDGLSRRLLAKAFGLPDGIRNPAFDRVAEAVAKVAATRGNKSGLRALGNAWVYNVAELMFLAIVELEKVNG